MPRQSLVLSGIVAWLWFLAPLPAQAERGAFDFSQAPRAVRRVEHRPSPPARAMATSATLEGPMPRHLWLVPLILTGAGLVGGVALCALMGADPDDAPCHTAMLVGIAVGALAGLTYLGVASCYEDADRCADDADDAEERGALKAPRRRGATRGPGRGWPLLPLRLMPSVGVVRDRAVFGLGGAF